MGRFLAVLAGLVALVIASAQWPSAQLDLTGDRRYTLSEPTRQLLREAEAPVQVEILLAGTLSADFRRLQSSTEEMLQRFRRLNPRLSYRIFDPMEGPKDSVRVLVERLADMGLRPVTAYEGKGSGESRKKLVFPAAIVTAQGRSLPLNLLDNQTPGMPLEMVINNSIGQLEYRLASTLQKVWQAEGKIVAFSTGRGELSPAETADLEQSLRRSYRTGRLDWDQLAYIAPEIDVLVVAKPTQPFGERERFLLDQYIMHGGKVLWLIDRLGADVDSLRPGGLFIPNDYPLELESLLFKYGVRIQPNLLMDQENTPIKLVTGQLGAAADFREFPWPFHPLVRPYSEHPMVKNLDRVSLRFASTIDTIRTATPVRKDILLRSSGYAALRFSPIELSFDILQAPLDPAFFNKSEEPVAVLLEGEFPSATAKRAGQALSDLLRKNGQSVRESSVPTAMVVVSDGDIARNDVKRDQSIMPLGYDEVMGYTFANKDFLLNAIEYLSDEGGLISVRNREVKLRLLDKARVAQSRSYWQALNLGLPLLLLGLFGLLYRYWRRRRYAH